MRISASLAMTSAAIVNVGFCAAPGLVETWSGTDAAGWERYDPQNRIVLPLANTEGWLNMTFDQQGMSMPEVGIMRAVSGSSDGAFTGDYVAALVTNVSFKFYCADYLPVDPRLYFYSPTASNWWYYPLTLSSTGVWVGFDVPLDCWKGWRMGSGVSAAQFRADLATVQWIGIHLQRNGSIEEQVYGMDDFVLNAAVPGADADEDGMDDWSEWLAGTDPNDPGDRFFVDIAFSNRMARLKWKSATNRLYAVLMDTNLLDGERWPWTVASGIQATLPTNMYMDMERPGNGPYYYKIQMEQ